MREQAKEISQMVNGRVDSNTIQLIQEASEILAKQQQELDNILDEINKLNVLRYLYKEIILSYKTLISK